LRYFLIAGEASGDLHGSNLIAEIFKQDELANIECWGGDLMQQKGAIVKKHIAQLAFMGFIDVLQSITTILKNFTLCKKQITSFQPDVIVLIDYPGFNLRMAKWCHRQGYKIIYYISPQLWAWKEKRVEQVRQYVHEMICILPFEKKFYAKHGIQASYVGHPLVKVISEFKSNHSSIIKNEKCIALLPGSRLQEIKTKLPIMLQVAERFPSYQFIIAQSPTLLLNQYPTKDFPTNVQIVNTGSYALLMNATAALVTSGTATLETALFGVPQIVCYKANAISYQIGKRLIKVPFISLVNLIAEKKVVTELIQHDFTVSKVAAELKKILLDAKYKQTILQEYSQIHLALGSVDASKEAAKIIIASININA
jgi:lipid-A-disaccharide synthase